MLGWLIFALLVFIQRGGSLRDMMQSILSILERLLLSPFESISAIGNARAAFASRASGRIDWRAAILPVLAVLTFTLLFILSNAAFSQIIANMFHVSINLMWIRIAITSLVVLQILLSILAMRATPSSQHGSLEADAPVWHAVLFSPWSVIATLLALNGVFLMHNLLDAQYLWSGALGQPGNAYAAYAQRGAFTLIITVLLAAGLMIISLWPGSRTNASPVVRLLVYVWIAQNGFLLLSCAARLMFYVDAYGLTLLRLASFIWMGLIACGLILVGLRILQERSNLWLVNANILAAFLVLWGSCFTDFNGIVARYNAKWSLENDRWDMDYLYSLGPAALPVISKLGKYGEPSRIESLLAKLRNQQTDWRRWTLRSAWLWASLPAQPESEWFRNVRRTAANRTEPVLRPAHPGRARPAANVPRRTRCLGQDKPVLAGKGTLGPAELHAADTGAAGRGAGYANQDGAGWAKPVAPASLGAYSRSAVSGSRASI